MYKFIDFTWNPIKGKCLHDCSYCYMKQINPNANLPRLAEHELNTYLGYGRSIFIGSSTDMFAENIPSEWIKRVLDYCYQNLEFINHPLMKRVVFCTTIETNRFYPEIMNNAPKIGERVEAMEEIARLGRSTMVTAEPLMQFDHEEMVSFIRKCKPKLVNIGRNSCRRTVLPEPAQEEVRLLIAELESFTKVNVKDNALEWCK